jgi:hypothetical protein
MGQVSVTLRKPSIERALQRDWAHIACILHHCGRFQTTFIRDYSVAGVGLVGARGITIGDWITIELLSGEKITGTVSWWLAGRCGLMFDTPLEESSSAYQRLETARQRRLKRLNNGKEAQLGLCNNRPM